MSGELSAFDGVVVIAVNVVVTDNVGLVVGISFLLFVVLLFVSIIFVYAYRHNEKFKRFWLRRHSDRYMYASLALVHSLITASVLAAFCTFHFLDCITVLRT